MDGRYEVSRWVGGMRGAGGWEYEMSRWVGV